MTTTAIERHEGIVPGARGSWGPAAPPVPIKPHIDTAQPLFRSVSQDGGHWLFLISADGHWRITRDGREVAASTARHSSVRAGIKTYRLLTAPVAGPAGPPEAMAPSTPVLATAKAAVVRRRLRPTNTTPAHRAHADAMKPRASRPAFTRAGVDGGAVARRATPC